MILWVNDFMLLGSQDDVEKMKSDLMSTFECKPEGPSIEYVGSEIDITRKDNGIARVKFTQPVLLQTLKDKFLFPVEGKDPLTPAVAGQVLLKGNGSGTIDQKEVTKFRSGTATCMYVLQWSQPETYNATRNLAWQMQAPRPAHAKALNNLI